MSDIRTVIQGTVDADANGRLARADISKTIEFCFKAFTHVSPEDNNAIIAKLKSYGLDNQSDDVETQKAIAEIEKSLTQEETQVLSILRGRRMLLEDFFHMESFTIDSIDGLGPRTELGKVGLKKTEAAKLNKSSFFSADYLTGKESLGSRATESKDNPTVGLNGNGMSGQPQAQVS